MLPAGGTWRRRGAPINSLSIFLSNTRPARRRYLASPRRFWFDLITSFPFSYFDLYIYEQVAPDSPPLPLPSPPLLLRVT